MAFGPFDFKPNINIAPDVFSSLANRYTGGLGAFQQNYQEAQKKAQWRNTINQLMQQENLPPMFKAMLPVMAQDPALLGQLGPELLKMGATGNIKDYATPQMAADFLGPSPEGQKFLADFTPGQPIPWSALKAEKSSIAQDKGLAARADWAQSAKARSQISKINTIYNQLNQLAASQGNALGAAATITRRVQTGIDLLNSPQIKTDPTVYQLVRSDLAAIAQGGAPSLVAQAEADMPTFKAASQRLLQRITANPQDINTPEVKQQLNSIFRVMGRAADRVIAQNTAGVKALWSKDPDATELIDRAVQYIGVGVKPEDPSTLPPLPPMPGVPTFSGDEASNASAEDLVNYAK